MLQYGAINKLVVCLFIFLVITVSHPTSSCVVVEVVVVVGVRL